MTATVKIVVKSEGTDDKIYNAVTNKIRVSPWDGTIRDVIADITFNVFKDNYSDDEFLRFVNFINIVRKTDNRSKAIQFVNKFLSNTEKDKVVFNHNGIMRLYYSAEAGVYMGEDDFILTDYVSDFTVVINEDLTDLKIDYEWLESLNN